LRVLGSSARGMWCAAGPTSVIGILEHRPNMRLKLAGLSLLKESEWLCPNGHELSFNFKSAGGLAARSLSAIR